MTSLHHAATRPARLELVYYGLMHSAESYARQGTSLTPVHVCRYLGHMAHHYIRVDDSYDLPTLTKKRSELSQNDKNDCGV